MLSLNEVWKSILTEDINWEAPELKALSPAAVDMLKCLLKRSSTERPSAKQALLHPWVKEEGEAPDLPLQGTVRLQRFSTFGRLKQMVLKMIFEDIQEERKNAIADNKESDFTTPERNSFVQAVQDLFNDIDTDRSGGIDLQELIEGLKRHGYRLTKNEVRQLADKVDFDHSGDIDQNELMTTLIDWSVLMQQESWKTFLDRAFNQLGLDGNGFITLNEMTYLDRAFNKLDLDGNGLITVDEIQARLGSINSSPSTSSVDAMEIEVWREAPVLSAHSSVAFSSS
eukprot:gene2422-8742_t